MTYRIGIVGGSLAGLAAANALHRLGHTVRVFEKAPAALESRGSSLGYVNNALWVRRGHPRRRWVLVAASLRGRRRAGA